MATVSGFTKERMLAIENNTVVGGFVHADGSLILQKKDGTQFSAGSVVGPPGEDAAAGSVVPVPDTSVIRTSDSRIKAANPTETNDVTTKSYVDSSAASSKTYVDNLVIGTELAANVNLNQVLTAGTYFQSDAAEAQTSLVYPVAKPGMLEVMSNRHPTNLAVWQRYTPFGEEGRNLYSRSYTNGLWSVWTHLQSPADLPAPVTVNGATNNSIVATSFANLPGSNLTATLVFDKPTIVLAVVSAWVVKTTANDIRVGLLVSGATSSTESQPNWGNVMWSSAEGTLDSQFTISKVLICAAGSNVFTVKAYVSTGSAAVNYPSLQLLPIRSA